MRAKLEPCHPRVQKPGCTCYDLQQLQMIAKALADAGHAIQSSSEHSRESLWREIDAIMRSEYNTEFDWAWRNVPPVKKLKDKRLMNETFRPTAPKEWTLHVQGGKSKQGKFVWLSNFDIDAVLKQYTSLDAFRDFKFFNCAPIDFDAIKDPLSKVNPVLCKRNGVNRIAAVINLDTHDLPGSHWVCLVANFSTGVIGYFDSYASFPEPEIQEYMARLCMMAWTGFDGKSFNASEAFPLIPYYNVTRMQYKGADCGVYAIYTVISFLLSDGTAEAFSSICSIPIDDDSMNDFRRALFVDSGFKEYK